MLTRVAAFPIGIDPDRFIKALETTQVKAHVAELLNRYAGRKVMLGVDRLDMIKGIPQKLLAYEKFLEENPDWRDKVGCAPDTPCCLSEPHASQLSSFLPAEPLTTNVNLYGLDIGAHTQLFREMIVCIPAYFSSRT
jgi:hypothetical protein